MLWALNRYIIKGEARFFKALQHKYNLIIDLYDIKKFHGGLNDNNYYHKNNHLIWLKQANLKQMDICKKEKSSYKPCANTGNPRQLRVMMLIKTIAKIS